MDEEIPKTAWRSFLEDVTAQRAGSSVVIEVLDPEAGDQHAADGLPLVTLRFDPDANSVEVELTDEGGGHATVRHSVHAPLSIQASPPMAGQVKAIRIDNGRVATLIEIETRSQLTA